MTAALRILVLHGPNLNLLGSREPGHYGRQTLAEINESLVEFAKNLSVGERSVTLDCRQSNAEHELVEWIQLAPGDATDFIVINPAAFTHTSVALRDALSAVKIPFIEVHLSNVQARESFRHHSYLSDIAIGTLSGFGARGYEYAIAEAVARLSEST
jgi:3-dehydroquinate dehydratase-2